MIPVTIRFSSTPDSFENMISKEKEAFHEWDLEKEIQAQNAKRALVQPNQSRNPLV